VSLDQARERRPNWWKEETNWRSSGLVHLWDDPNWVRNKSGEWIERRHNIEFRRQIAQKFLSGETLDELAQRYDIHANLIKIWASQYEEGAYDEGGRNRRSA
jgi:hypothetical protein